MEAQFVNPFLTSSIQVIETLIQVKPVVGSIHLKPLRHPDKELWLNIQIVGSNNKMVVFGFTAQTAMNMVSRMMGGYPVHELDEMCMSAVSELGNMISGNASTILSLNGIHVDITPPALIGSEHPGTWGAKAFCIPIHIENIGEFEINMI